MRCLGTCAHPELIDAGSVVALLASETDSYGFSSEAKRSRAAVSADVLAEHFPVPAQCYFSSGSTITYLPIRTSRSVGEAAPLQWPQRASTVANELMNQGIIRSNSIALTQTPCDKENEKGRGLPLPRTLTNSEIDGARARMAATSGAQNSASRCATD